MSAEDVRKELESFVLAAATEFGWPEQDAMPWFRVSQGEDAWRLFTRSAHRELLTIALGLFRLRGWHHDENTN